MLEAPDKAEDLIVADDRLDKPVSSPSIDRGPGRPRDRFLRRLLVYGMLISDRQNVRTKPSRFMRPIYEALHRTLQRRR